MPPRSSPSTNLPCFRGNIGDDDHDDNDFPFRYQDDHDDGGDDDENADDYHVAET